MYVGNLLVLPGVCLDVRYIGNDRPQNSSDLGIYISKLYMSQIAPFPRTSARRVGDGWGVPLAANRNELTVPLPGLQLPLSGSDQPPKTSCNPCRRVAAFT
jgi:hypothetical protein